MNEPRDEGGLGYAVLTLDVRKGREEKHPFPKTLVEIRFSR